LELFLHLADAGILFTGGQAFCLDTSGVAQVFDVRPDADPGLGETGPREVLAGVLLAQGRDVGMADDPRLRNVMAGKDPVAELDQGLI
jgi:hypothetical protein